MKTINFIVTLLLVAAFTACGSGASNKPECTVTIVSPGEEYAQAVLYDVDNRVLDSVVFSNNEAVMVRRDTSEMPYLGFLRFYNPADSLDFIELPMAVERGDVNIDLSHGIGLSGTPLNERVHGFLIARARLNSQFDIENDTSVTVEGLRKAFSQFYVEQINANRDNVLGDFLRESYGIHVLPADRPKLK